MNLGSETLIWLFLIKQYSPSFIGGETFCLVYRVTVMGNGKELTWFIYSTHIHEHLLASADDQDSSALVELNHTCIYQVSPLSRDFIDYYSHLFIAIAIQSKYCQVHFTNGGTEAQKEQITKNGNGSEPRCDCKCPIHSPVWSFPTGSLNASAQVEKASLCAGLTMGSSVSGKCKAVCLPSFQVEKSRNPQGGNCSLKLSYLEIFLNSWEEFLSPPAFFWENSCVSMEVWVMSLRNNTHSYPTEI